MSSSYASWYQGSSAWASASGSRAREASFPPGGPRGELGKRIPRRPQVSWWLGLVLAFGFAVVVTPLITAERWLPGLGLGAVKAGAPAKVTVRVPPFAGVQTAEGKISGGGVLVARGAEVTAAQEDAARRVAASHPRGAFPYAALFALVLVFGAVFTHHMRRSIRGRLRRVQIVSLVTIAALALAIKALMLTTSASILAVPVALLAVVPTMALDRVVGIATGVLAALITSLLVPFDVTVAILLLVQASAAGLLVAEGPKHRVRAALIAGLVTTLLTAATLLLIAYLTRDAWPSSREPLRSPWLAAAVGPAIAMVLAVPLLPLYQLLVGEITQAKLVELEDLSHPLLRQIAERAPGTWQHSLMMANMAEIAANAIGASGRLVRVGAYFHDLGKSLSPKYFIENLEPGETSPHDQLPPEVSCGAIFAHVTEGIAAARRAGLHERIIDFMHMHHGDGVLEYFWGKAKEQGQRGLTLDDFRYPGHPPQSRETAILAICDAVEAASRTLKRPDPAAIDALVQRIVYGKLHLGQLDESGLSMSDLRRVSDSLRETIRHANHGRIEYPWQKAEQDASASGSLGGGAGTQPRLDSLDRTPRRETAVRAPARPPAQIVEDGDGRGEAPSGPAGEEDLGIVETAPLAREEVAGSAAPADTASAPAVAPAPAEPAGRNPPIGERTQVGLAPAPDLRGGPAPVSDALDTPVMPAMMGELVRSESRAAAAESPADTAESRKRAAALPAGPARKPPTLPPPPPGRKPPTLPPPAQTTLAGHRPAGMPGLAARVDAALQDEWSNETPVVAPPPEELRALLGAPDPTRQQSLDELEALHRASDELYSEPELLAPPPRRAPPPTSEVDPDQIEAAIELAPPARRAPHAAPPGRPKKPE